jgi:hypothetical protein
VTLTMTFKCLNGMAPSYLSDKFSQRTTVHDLTREEGGGSDMYINSWVGGTEGGGENG